MNLIGKVSVLGAGLLGASFARAVKAAGAAECVSTWSRSESTRAKSRALSDVFDIVCDTPSEAVQDADLVVLCTPTEHIPLLAKEIAPSLKKGAIITDVGSVKRNICEKCAAAINPTGAIFIGSHPMAGSEKIGIDYSDASLFQGRPCFVTPETDEEKRSAAILRDVWEAVGMRVHFVSPAEHDKIVSRVSHLPHLLAGLLCITAANFEKEDLRNYAGPGFRDTTRVASGSPEIWDSIISDNKKEIVDALKSYAANFNEMLEALERGDMKIIGEMLRKAKDYRDKL